MRGKRHKINKLKKKKTQPPLKPKVPTNPHPKTFRATAQTLRTHCVLGPRPASPSLAAAPRRVLRPHEPGSPPRRAALSAQRAASDPYRPFPRRAQSGSRGAALRPAGTCAALALHTQRRPLPAAARRARDRMGMARLMRRPTQSRIFGKGLTCRLCDPGAGPGTAALTSGPRPLWPRRPVHFNAFFGRPPLILPRAR